MVHGAFPVGTADILLFLAAAGVVVPILHRLGIGQVTAYLAIGVLIGPHVLGALAGSLPWLAWATFTDPAAVERLGGLGGVFLLFVLGLDLSLERLARLRRWIAGLGLLQVTVTGLVIGLIAWALGNPPVGALVLGTSLALSSTAIFLQLLIERRRQATLAGRVAFAVLLAQDLAVVPILLLVELSTRAGGEEPWLVALETVLLSGVLVAGLLLAGRRGLRPLLRLASRVGGREVLAALALLLVIGSAWLAALAGASPALGAFVAGVLLAETDFQHTVAADIEPFKGLLMGLFFVTVGSTVDPLAILADGPRVAPAVAGLVLLKAAIVAALGRALGLPRDVAVEVGVLLGQGGEFALVVLAFAASGGLLPAEVANFVVAVVLVSMLVAPALSGLAPRLGELARGRAARRAAAEPPRLADHAGHVVIAGFGRVGRTVARLLDDARIPWLALDLDADLASAERARGRDVHVADASRPEILARARLDAAQALIVTLDHPDRAERAVAAARRIAPAVAIVARARDGAHGRRLAALGAGAVVPEAVEASLQLAGRALETLGVPVEEVAERLARQRASLLGDS